MTSSAGDEPRRRPSIKDVAAVAGVSFQTVSKVLRGQGTVTDATRERIHAAADEVGYLPDAVARSLVTRRTRTLGLVVGDLSDHVVARFVSGAEREARAAGLAVVIASLEPDRTGGARSVASLLSGRVDGIIAAAPHREEDDRLGELLRGVPSAAIHSVPGGGVPLVGSDQREVGRLATDHLLATGRVRVATITGSPSRHVTSSRVDGWRDAHAGHGAAVDEELVEAADWSPQGGYDALVRLRGRVPDVDAVFVHNDDMAVGVLHALADAGLAVPGDVAIVACDDVPVAAHTLPPLSTVRLPFAATGAAAVRVLLGRLAGTNGADDPTVLLDVELVCRASCGCAATEEGR